MSGEGYVRTKSDFYKRWNNLEFGNKPHTWETLTQALESGFAGEIAIRYKGKMAGGPFIPGLRIADLPGRIAELSAQGFAQVDFNFSEVVNGAWSRINGEIGWYAGKYHMLYSLVPALMRDSLARGGVEVSGLLQPRLILLNLLGERQADWIFELLERYPNHVVEFSGYDRRVGVLNENFVVWEVRLY